MCITASASARSQLMNSKYHIHVWVEKTRVSVGILRRMCVKITYADITSYKPLPLNVTSFATRFSANLHFTRQHIIA
jgi:S-adenosylmethionine synthetase